MQGRHFSGRSGAAPAAWAAKVLKSLAVFFEPQDSQGWADFLLADSRKVVTCPQSVHSYSKRGIRQFLVKVSRTIISRRGGNWSLK